MPNYRRSRVSGGSYFFTVTSLRRRPVLTQPALRQALRIAIQQTRISHPFDIDAWVLLPEHLHCIWTLPPDDANFSLRWSMIKRLVSQACAAELGMPVTSTSGTARREAGLWQRRFWEHQIRDDDDFARHVDYIHWNPVKHGLVSRAGDWPYSTFHRYVEQGMLLPDWGIGVVPDVSHRFGE
ncbi:REP-associated tyrosine transposase [Undibacterium sp. Ji49W]|uniref:REP-associated tyrosine transposase n=1 Tax=Undibacterium sp. Ji49W TaxID=3413040 RepID=UPI003BF1B335